MVALRKANAYSKKYARPFTRVSKKKSKSYIKTIPPKKLVKMQMGKPKMYRSGKFPYIVKLMSKEKVQLRDNALEASRQFINNKLTKDLKGIFYFEVKVVPHHILRENKMLTGAGADRMQSGMQLSYGKTMGRAALIKPNQVLFLVAADTEKNIRVAHNYLSKIKSKLPCKSVIVFEHKK